MMGITGICSRLVIHIVQAFGNVRSRSAGCLDPNPITSKPRDDARQVDDDFMIRALTSVFGMENNGQINKEKARRVVEQLGLVYIEEEEKKEEEEEEEEQQQQQKDESNIIDAPAGAMDNGFPVEEVLSGLEDRSDRHKLLHEAFRIFDEDGNGHIDAKELKRVLQCLGLDKGWNMEEIEKMLNAADLNLDGTVDFSEFELMMG